MRVAVDAMGGDRAPAEIVKGVCAALETLSAEDTVVVFGDQAQVEPLMTGDWRGKVELVHCTQVVGFDEHPVEALRHKRDSSIMRMAWAASDGKVDAIISAGNTGAMVAACQMKMRALEGVNRPGIGVVLPTFHGPVTICDVGANVQCKPINLHQYAQMGSIYSRHVLGIERPRVGLLSIGEEDAKGNELVKQARQKLKADTNLNFLGNVEGRDVVRGAVDVITCEGFVGNVILKLTEGLAEGLMKTIAKEIADESPQLGQMFAPVVQKIWRKHDYNEYGGAPLLGVDGICIICHGSSNYRAIVNAIRVAREYARQDINGRIKQDLKAAVTQQ
ncbi:MAG: phosphate acyltransferase PlsX [Phycisphaerae bacterium]|nr:phosphate acyltransferase PlsX [Phycisphaerae bacterium]